MVTVGSHWQKFFRVLAVTVPTGITFIDVVGCPAKVEGCSMQPVLNPWPMSSDWVFLYSWPITTNSFGEIQRGDIVALVSPKNPRQRIIKRVIALEGDLVETKNGRSPYVRIPEGHCWIEGDHRNNSRDSQEFGPVALGLIKAKASCIVWPPSRWQYLDQRQRTNKPDRENRSLTLIDW